MYDSGQDDEWISTALSDGVLDSTAKDILQERYLDDMPLDETIFSPFSCPSSPLNLFGSDVGQNTPPSFSSALDMTEGDEGESSSTPVRDNREEGQYQQSFALCEGKTHFELADTNEKGTPRVARNAESEPTQSRGKRSTSRQHQGEISPSPKKRRRKAFLTTPPPVENKIAKAVETRKRDISSRECSGKGVRLPPEMVSWLDAWARKEVLSLSKTGKPTIKSMRKGSLLYAAAAIGSHHMQVRDWFRRWRSSVYREYLNSCFMLLIPYPALQLNERDRYQYHRCTGALLQHFSTSA